VKKWEKNHIKSHFSGEKAFFFEKKQFCGLHIEFFLLYLE